MGWLAFVLLGLAGVAATPLYLLHQPYVPGGQGVVLVRQQVAAPDLFGTFSGLLNGSVFTPWYWLAAFAVVYGTWPLISRRFEPDAAGGGGGPSHAPGLVPSPSCSR